MNKKSISSNLILLRLLLGCLVALIAYAAVSLHWLGVALIGCIWLIVALAYKPSLAVPVLLTIALITVRPNIWGEDFSPVGVGILLLVACFVHIQSDSLASRRLEYAKAISVAVWVAASYFWILWLSSNTGAMSPVAITTGALLSIIAILSVAAICSTQERAKMVLQVFVGLTIIACVSYALTLFLWLILSPTGTVYARVVGGGFDTPIPIHFPLTPTMATLQVFGISVPRFVGFGREPGWMALWAGSSILLYQFTGWKRRWPLLVLGLGVVGTLSTAGFALLVICIALRSISKERRSGVASAAKLLTTLALVPVSIWMGLYAPVLGLVAKESQNAVSLNERTAATLAGLRALINNPFEGGQGADVVGSVNLIAAIAVQALPWVICITVAVIWPLWNHPARRNLLPFTIYLFGTLLGSQPAQDSIWVFCLVVVVAVASLPKTVGTVEIRATKSMVSLG